MTNLTRRQSQILNFIRKSIERQGMPPTVAEIALAMGVQSTNGIRGHLQALARKGVLKLIPGASRGIRLLDTPEHSRGLPLVGRVAAGDPILAEQHIEEYCQVDASLFRPKANFLLRVYGMSMRDAAILDGDLLAVHRTPEGLNGQIVVARWDDEVTVKRFRRKGNIVYLQAENPDFATLSVNLRKQALYIEGVVVGVIRRV